MHYHFLSNLSLPPYGNPQLAELGEVNLLIAVLVRLVTLVLIMMFVVFWMVKIMTTMMMIFLNQL